MVITPERALRADVPALFLGLPGILTAVPGVLHAFLPNGSAGVIAGLDLSANAKTIIGVFACR